MKVIPITLSSLKNTFYGENTMPQQWLTHDWRTNGFGSWIDAAWTGGGCNLSTSLAQGLISTCAGQPFSQGAYLDTNVLGTGAPFQFKIETTSSSFVLYQLDSPPPADGSTFGEVITAGADGAYTVSRRYLHLVSSSNDFRFQRYQWLVIDESEQEGNLSCVDGHAATDVPQSENPVSLRFGEKRFQVRDLVSNTPAGALAFTRTYHQNRQFDPEMPSMGLGWKHNHAVTLSIYGVSPTRTARIHPPGGGVLILKETSSNQFTASAGSGATMTFDNSLNEYVVTRLDRTRYRFDASTGRLKILAFSNNDEWTYTYTSGRLTEVNDGYGRNLQFAYVANPGAFDDGLLWRVGDQTTLGLSTVSPSGRYIEFTYTSEKQNGVPIANPKPLLTQVRDVRGNVFTYDYYGQDAGETTSTLLNLMIERRVPALNITPERVSYSFAASVERITNGGMEADSDWTNLIGATPTTNERSTIQVQSGSYSRYVVTSAAEQGIESAALNFRSGRRYTVTASIYVVSGTVKMQVTSTNAFDRISNAGTGSWQTLQAIYVPGASLPDQRLQFIATNGPATFYVDSVSVQELQLASITQQRGIEGANNALLQTVYDFEYTNTNTTRETTAGKPTLHRFARGMYGGTDDPANYRTRAAYDTQFRTTSQTDANGNTTQMAWSSDGKRLNSITDALNRSTTFSYNPNDTLSFSLDAEGRKTEYTYGDATNPRLPTRIKVIDANGTTVLRWQEFVYDAKGRTVEEKTLEPANGTTLQNKITRVYGTSGNGNGLLESVNQLDLITPANNVSTTYTYDSAGRVVKTQQSSLFGNCQVSYTVYDAAGNVLASICNYVNTGAAPTTSAQAVALYNPALPDQNRVTTHEYDPLGRRTKTTNNAGANYAQSMLTVYDGLDRVVRTISNYVPDAGIPNPAVAAHSAFQHGSDNTQNLVTDTAYNARGMVRLQRDVLGNITLYGYNDADRVVKTVQSASQPGYNNDYIGTAPDPTLNGYVANGLSDQDMVTSNIYDPAGNLIQAVDTLGHVTFTSYDALNRPVRTVRSAKSTATIALNPGDAGYNASNDPRSTSYVPSLEPDRDAIETTDYDAMGRVYRTQQLLENRPAPQWDTTLIGYDALGRQVKTIRQASQPNYNVAADPSLNGYVASTVTDQDIITKTAYDAFGRVLYTEDTLGSRIWFRYDGLGRQIKAVANAVGTATDNGINDPRSDSYVASSSADLDLITFTNYNSDGLIQWTQDSLGRKTWFVYDTLGRRIRTITNYVDQGEDPKLWVWNNGWKRSNGTTAISHGADNDQNIVTTTTYDAQGRAQTTGDHRNNVTRTVYDILGRQVKTIAGYVAQGTSDPANWVWSTANSRWENGAGTAISFGAENDQNRISATIYDIAGRVIRTRDAAGLETRHEYDAVWRRIKTTSNYVDGTFSATTPDEDLITLMTYNKGGQLLETTDARGTKTVFGYDAMARQRTVTQAATSPLAVTTYTAYDKSGRTLRIVQQYLPGLADPSPDARDASGNWLFNPSGHGLLEDQNRITTMPYDAASRTISVSDPLGNIQFTAYDKDGQVRGVTDPEGMNTQYRYDGLRRRTLVVQSYAANGQDPSQWVWDAADARWEQSGGTAIGHGTNSDQNILVRVTYDKGGRMLSLRDPRGNLTTYSYDGMDRRKTLTNPTSKSWATTYENLVTGETRTTLTNPNGATHQVRRDFDRFGRLRSVAYLNESPKSTPDVRFSYDIRGNRTKMGEFTGANFTNRVRETQFTFDKARRMKTAAFDDDGNGTLDATVAYEYDAGGRRTKLTLPGALNVTYSYDVRGQLVSLTDWDGQISSLVYDNAGRLVATDRANSLRTRYAYDAAGRLTLLRHTSGRRTLAHFGYTVDRRGNRTQAVEYLARPATIADVTIAYNDVGITYVGAWTDAAPFKVTTALRASMRFLFGINASAPPQPQFTFGTGPDHGLFDVYVGGSLWQSYDGYAAATGERTVSIPLDADGPFVFEVRNRADKQTASTGYKLRFKQLVVADVANDVQTIQYTYDALSRLLSADYYPGGNLAGVPARAYDYAFDRAGNRLSESLSLNGVTPTVRTWTYNAANQITNSGFSYDNNGNLLNDGVTAYTWDRANRMLSAGATSYGYDGLGNRVSQTVGATANQFLLDLQPGLAVVLANTSAGSTSRFVHGPMGIHAQKDSANNWEWMVQDGLGSVRGVTDNVSAVLWNGSYDPFGTGFGANGTVQTTYGFTGERYDAGTDLLYLRARHYKPGLGTFTARDPFEGVLSRAMSLNSYSWVEGNVPNFFDPSGRQVEVPPVPMPFETFARYMAGGATAAAALCTGPQAAACVAIAGAALLAVGSGVLLYQALVNADWDAYRAYEAVIANANQGRYPQPPVRTPTAPPVLPPNAYPGERFNENPFAGDLIYSAPQPQPDLDDESTPSPDRLPFPVSPCTLTPTPTPTRARRNILFGQRRIGELFSTQDNVPFDLRRRNIYEIAREIRTGQRPASTILVQVFEDTDSQQLIAINNRGLATLSIAGQRPTRVERRTPSRRELIRLRQTIAVPVWGGVPNNLITLPGEWTAVTPSQSQVDLEDVMDVIRVGSGSVRNLA